MKSEFAVGGIFIVAVILVGVLTIVVQDISILKGRVGELKVVFDKVSGLEKGHKVLASGMEVGRVHDLKLLSDGKVEVWINLLRDVPLRDGYRIVIQDTSALGGKEIDISLGKGEMLTNEELKSSLKGVSQPSFLTEASDVISENRDGIRDIVHSIKQVTKEIEDGKGTIGLLIKERELYDDLRAASSNLKKISEQLTKAEGTIGKLLYENELYDKVNRILGDVEVVTGKLRRGEGTIGKLLMDDSLYVEVKNTFVEAKNVMKNMDAITTKVRNGEGTIGRLFTDDSLYTDMTATLLNAKSALSEIDRLVKRVNAGEGVIGALVTDRQMSENFKDTIYSIKVVAERLRKGEGTMGKLLADDTLYKEIRRVVKDLSDSIEDSREQVPITTFTNVLFNAF